MNEQTAGAADELVASAFAWQASADKASADAVADRVMNILRPAGALARLDELAVWLAGWQGTETPSVDRPVALIFAGDHGVVAEGVSAYPSDVTGAMLAAFDQGKASVSAMAAVAGAEVTAIDVGVAAPTGNIRLEPAMSQTRFTTAFDAGRSAVANLFRPDPAVDRAPDLLIIGEMGIGNTTAAAAVCSALLDRPGVDTVDRGTGVDGPALATKIRIVDQATARANREGAFPHLPMEVMRQLGGTELVAMAGAMVEARHRSMPILLDGYVTAAPALALHRYASTFGHRLDDCFRAGHGSAERGHGLVLDALGLEPLLALDFRLGEASGAMAALPLLKMACRLVTEVPTFAEWFGGD